MSARVTRIEILTDRLSSIRIRREELAEELAYAERAMRSLDKFGATPLADGCWPLRVRIHVMRLERALLAVRVAQELHRRANLLESRTEERLLRLVNGKPQSLRAQREERSRFEVLVAAKRARKAVRS